MPAKLVAISDSLTQDFQSGSISKPHLMMQPTVNPAVRSQHPG
jgi:hypothetical protein